MPMPYRRPVLARISAAIAVALVIASGASGQTRGRSFLWKVQSGANVMFLAGSVHALTADAYPLNPAYQRAFDASGALVEEINLAEADPLNGARGLARARTQAASAGLDIPPGYVLLEDAASIIR